MRPDSVIRQGHRWLSIVFTLTVIANLRRGEWRPASRRPG